MRTISWAVALLVAATFLNVGAVADDSTQDAVVQSWNSYQAAMENDRAKRAEIMAELRKAASDAENRAAAQAEARRKLGELAEALEKPRKDFLAAFGKADFTKYLEHTEMVEAGLYELAGEKREIAPADAEKLYEAYLKYCGEARRAGQVRTSLLPRTIMATGELDRAIERTTSLMNEVPDNQRAGMQMMVADFTAAKGETEAASKMYNEIKKSLADIEFQRGDARASVKRYVEARANLTGKEAPDFTCETWFGSDKKSLSDFKGNVVVIDFWATWCGPCRVAMPGMNKMYSELKDQGLEVIGLTRVYKDREGNVSAGYLPESEGEIVKVRRVDGLDEEGYVKHIGEFRDISGIGYAFAVGAAEDFQNYGVTGIPQMVIVDKHGKVAMVIIGSGNDALIEACVKSLLKSE